MTAPSGALHAPLPATMSVVAVPGSHGGLVWNVHVYRALARHLAGARAAARPSA